jgi:nucleoid-associated protein YgaU
MKLVYTALFSLAAIGCSTTEEKVPEEVVFKEVVKEQETQVTGPINQQVSTVAEKSVNTDMGLSGTSPSKSIDKTYTVVKGDSLWKISGKQAVYNDPFLWPVIYKANRTQIKDADLIYPKQVFNIPAEYDAKAAIKHAKSRGAWVLNHIESSDLKYLN